MRNNIPYLYDYECYGNKNFLIQSLLIPSLNKIIKFTNCEFDISTVAILGIQMILSLKNLHNIGIIHNDIKPSNICWGKFINGIFDEKNNFFLIDFGYSRYYIILSKIINKNNINEQNIKKIHIKDKLENSFHGTPRYMAIPIADGFRPSRRTDLEELIYTLLFLLKKSLPWDGIKGKIHSETCRKMNEIKRNIKADELFDNLPEEFIYIYKNIRKLNFDETPEYGLYKLLFENILRKLNVNNNNFSEFCFSKKFNSFLEKLNLEKPMKTKKIKDFFLFKGYPTKIYEINKK